MKRPPEPQQTGAGRRTGDIIESMLALTEQDESPATFRRWTAISMVASCLQRKTWQSMGAHTVYPNLYVLLVGPPAARKGTAMNPAGDILRDLDVRIAPKRVTKEQLITFMARDAQQWLEYGTEIIKHNSITIHSPEFVVFMHGKDADYLSLLCDWFDCTPHWDKATKHHGTDFIDGVWVNLIGAITPTLLRNNLPAEATGGGFASRTIFVYAPGREKINPWPAWGKTQHDLRAEIIHDLGRVLSLRGEFDVTAEAKSLYMAWYQDACENPPFKGTLLEEYAERRAVHLRSLMMIHSASRHDTMVVDANDFHRSYQTLLIAEQQMHKVFRGFGMRDLAGIMGEMISFVEKQGVATKQQLYERFVYDADKRDIQDMLGELVAAGRLSSTLQGTTQAYCLGAKS